MATSVDTEVVEVYLDHAAAPRCAPRRRRPGRCVGAAPRQPDRCHRAVRAARRALDDARDEIAALDRPPAEVVFTSGGSEADNLAIRGVLHAQGEVAVCSAGEHHAVLEPVEHAEGPQSSRGRRHRLPIGSPRFSTPRPAVSVADHGHQQRDGCERHPGSSRPPDVTLPARFHTDAVQALGWIDLAAHVEDADLISITGHKFGGPVGTGALFVRHGVELDAQILGEARKRSTSGHTRRRRRRPAAAPRPRLPLATPMSCASAHSEIASWWASVIGSVRSWRRRARRRCTGCCRHRSCCARRCRGRSAAVPARCRRRAGVGSLVVLQWCAGPIPRARSDGGRPHGRPGVAATVTRSHDH